MSKTWGSPCWIFFHSYAEHVPEDYYNRNKEKIFKTFLSTLSRLPCPYCRKHALNYHKNIKKPFQTKQEFKEHLFKFHNNVNQRLKKPIFNNFHIYEKVNLKKAYLNFAYVMSQRFRNGVQLGVIQSQMMVSSWRSLLVF